MRKRTWLSALLAVSLVVGSVMPVGAAETAVTENVEVQMEEGDEIVEIPDENLKGYLVHYYDSDGDKECSVSELGQIKELSLPSNMTDLTGLEYAVNLESLRVESGNISDLTPLENKTELVYLELDNNNISDISPLKNSKKMNRLSLSSNSIKDISALSEMKDLVDLDLDDNEITDISAVSGLTKVMRLSLRNNPVVDLKPLIPFEKLRSGYAYLSGNELITKELLFETFFPEIQTKKITLGNKYALDLKLSMLMVQADVRLSGTDITWTNSNPDVVEIVGTQPYIVGKKVGIATITGTLNGIERSYEIEVVDPPIDTTESVEQYSDVEEIDDRCGAVLDLDNTLWSINSNKNAEKVKSDVQKYIGEVVYGAGGDSYWADYFVLDNESSLWKSSKENSEAEYSNEKIFTDVEHFDKYMALLSNGDLYELETGERAAENIKQYYTSKDFYTGKILLHDIVLTRDNQVKSLKNNQILVEDVEQIYYEMDGCDFSYIKDSILYIWIKNSLGEYLQIGTISGVASVIYESNHTFFLIMENGTTGYFIMHYDWDSDTYSIEYKKISDYPLVTSAFGGFIDSIGDYWEIDYDDNLDRCFNLAASNVKTLYSRYYYMANDNKVYQLTYSDEGSTCILENAKKYDGNLRYYISSDNILYEEVGYDSMEYQQLMTDVYDFAGIYIVRNDGSIWVCPTMRSGKGAPYCVMPASVQLVNPFVDVQESDWYYNAVSYVHRNGIMAGMTEDSFGAGELLARAQFATMLYRLEGTPETVYEGKFSDVPNSQWYTNAVIWASNNNIVSGYKNTTLFGSADNITREQIAVMMYRYAQYKGYDISEKASLDRFTDAGSVSAYAVEAMQWAVGNGIINGTGDGRLNPLGTAYRAECAVIFKGFMEKYDK